MEHSITNGVVFDNRDLSRYTPGERRMPMRGFEPEYTDIVDYIIRITHRIWEEKAVGYIYDTYHHNCVMHTSSGDIHGREPVVAATLQSLAAFSDDRTYGDDVIWTGNENDGFHTSHLISGTGWNTGYTAYGPPTGRKVAWRTMANCFSKENRIFEEWILRDETSVIRQLGYDVHAIVQQQARALLDRGLAEETTVETARTRGQYAPEAYKPRAEGRFDIEDFVRDTYHEIWNRRMLNRVEDRFSPSHVCYTNSNRMLVGTPDRIGAILGLFAMFPDATVVVDQVYGNGDDTQGYHVAVRWTLTGTHTGYGPFGEPSNARVQVMALSQHHIKHGTFTNEYTLLDEMGMLRRIAVQRLRTHVSSF